MPGRWWRASRIDVLAASVADGLGLILRIWSLGEGGPGPTRDNVADANLSGAVRRPGIRRPDMEGAESVDTARCSTLAGPGGVPAAAASTQCRIRYADTV